MKIYKDEETMRIESVCDYPNCANKARVHTDSGKFCMGHYIMLDEMGCI
jgi:hypothetical protein